MRRTSFQQRLIAGMLAVAGVVATPAASSACSVCYGDPNSSMVQGAKAGVLFLGIVIYVLLMGIGGVIVFWTLRARKLDEAMRVAKAGAGGVEGNASKPSAVA